MHSAAGCRRTRVGDACVPNRCQSTSGARHASRNPESCFALDGASAARDCRKHIIPFQSRRSSQSLSPFEKTLCTFTRNARPPSAQLKSTQTRPAASVNCHLCSTMTCFGASLAPRPRAKPKGPDSSTPGSQRSCKEPRPFYGAVTSHPASISGGHSLHARRRPLDQIAQCTAAQV